MFRMLEALRDLRLVRGHSFVASLISRGGIVIDAGAHRCEFANVMAEKFGVHVISLEPNEALVVDYLHPNVTLMRAALAAREGRMHFAVDDNPEASHIVSEAAGSEENVRTIETTSLDALLRPLDEGEVDLLKLDVEGAEYEVLIQASFETLMRFRQISIEFHPYNASDEKDMARIEKVISRMSEAGFRFVRCSKNGFGDVLFINPKYDIRLSRPFAPLVRKWLEFKA